MCTAPATCVNMSCGLKPNGSTCTARDPVLSRTFAIRATACAATPPARAFARPASRRAAPQEPAQPSPPVGRSLNDVCHGSCQRRADSTARVAATTRQLGPRDVASTVTPARLQRAAGSSRARASTAPTSPAAVQTNPANCANGVCPAVTTKDCAPYSKCIGTPPTGSGADGLQCASSCSTNADCVGTTCNTLKGKCGDKQAKGDQCNASAPCDTSLTCVDGVCCDTPCSGACQSCNQAGLAGTCSPVTSGPDTLCVAAPPCGNTGSCSSGGACAQGATTTTCLGPVCMSPNLLSQIGHCNGSGMCKQDPEVPCGGINGLKCKDDMSCLDACTSDSDCVMGTKCANNGTCNGKVQGAACSTGECAVSFTCVDGVCCNSACAGACQACNASGNCVAVTSGSDVLCGTATTCNLGTCATGTATQGTCAKASTTVSCGAAPMCSGSTLTQSHCDGAGTSPPRPGRPAPTA